MADLFSNLPNNDKENIHDRDERKRFEYEANKFYGLLEELNKTLSKKPSDKSQET